MRLISEFQPPDGTRLIWHSLKDKQLWEPRIQRITSDWHERERESVAQGWRKLTLQPISRGFQYERLVEWARNHNLAVMPVRAVGRFEGFAHRYTSGEDMYVVALAEKPEYAEDPEPEKWLGYPDCCQQFFAAHFPQFIDPIWQWADGRAQVGAHPYANPLLRYWSLRFVPHIPCSPTCEGSIALGERFASLMGEEERAWLWELLSGPITWNCLHGVAEIVTKPFRIIVGSNPTSERYSVRSECLT